MGKRIIILALLAVACVPVRAAMTLLYQETFTNPGILSSNSLGSFSQVTNILRKCAVGPGGWSADVLNANTKTAGIFSAGVNETQVVACAWYYFKNTGANNANETGLFGISGSASDPNPTLHWALKNGALVAAQNGQTTATIPIQATNQWIFLMVAGHYLGSAVTWNWNSRMYYMTVGGTLTHLWGTTNQAFNPNGAKFYSFGQWASASQFGNLRFGYPSVYRFTQTDFSDIAYPSDIPQPTNSGNTWYLNTSTGNDANSGTSASSAWLTLTNLNSHSANCGLLPANTYSSGDTVIVDTYATPLDCSTTALTLQTTGLNIRAPSTNQWITVAGAKTIQPSEWQAVPELPAVYSTTNTVALACLWEDNKWLNHPSGSTLAAVSNSLQTVPGSFWVNTAGTTNFVHPFSNTDPRSDGKIYTRSNPNTLVNLNAGNMNVQDLFVTKSCDVAPLAGTPNGGYGIGTGGSWCGTNLIKHCYIWGAGKHGIGLVVDVLPGEVTTIESCQVEQDSPYGSQTPFVSFTGGTTTNITHYYTNCVVMAGTGLVGSTNGVSGICQALYSHNSSSSNQFSLISINGCNFNYDTIGGISAAVAFGVTNSTFGGVSCAGSNVSVDQCRWTAACPQQVAANTLVVKNSIITPSPSNVATFQDGTAQLMGTATLQGNTYDFTSAVQQGGFVNPGVMTRVGATTLLFRNNLVIMPLNSGANHFSVFKNFQASDTIVSTNNLYVLNGQQFAYHYTNSVPAQTNMTLVQWQAVGFDANSVDSVNQTDSRWKPYSNGYRIGAELGPLTDYTGKLFQSRRTAGAYEYAPTIKLKR